MILNIMIPMPMPVITNRGASCNDANEIIAVGITFFVLGLLLYLGGFIYEGVKHEKWELFSDDNFAEISGAVTMATLLLFAFIFVATNMVYALLFK